MWELDHKEGWGSKNWCFQIVLEKALEIPLDSQEIKPVNPKWNQPWIVIGRTVAEAPILWPCDTNSQLTRKDPAARKHWRQKEQEAREDKIDSITDSMDMNLSKLQEIVKDRKAWCATVCWVAKSHGHNFMPKQQHPILFRIYIYIYILPTCMDFSSYVNFQSFLCYCDLFPSFDASAPVLSTLMPLSIALNFFLGH